MHYSIILGCWSLFKSYSPWQCHRDSTIRIEGLQIKKGEAIKVIEETEAITGLNTVLAVVDNVDSGTCDVTLDSKLE
jgi:hypothetical protein